MKQPAIRTVAPRGEYRSVAMRTDAYAKVKAYCKAHRIIIADFVGAACVKAMNEGMR